jgi:hypothetical protein
MIAVIGIFPLSVSAQGNSPPVEQGIESIDPSRLVVIGAGILLGAVAMEVLVAGDIAILAGAVAGGFVTDWWYRTRENKTVLPKAKFRAAAFPVRSDVRLAMLPRQ